MAMIRRRMTSIRRNKKDEMLVFILVFVVVGSGVIVWSFLFQFITLLQCDVKRYNLRKCI